MAKKSDKFKEEQEQLKKDLLAVIQLKDAPFNSDIKTITLNELDQPDTKQKVIYLLPRLKQFFAVKNKVFCYPDNVFRLHMSIIKEVLKDTYKMTSTFVRDGSIKTRRYHFYPIKSI